MCKEALSGQGNVLDIARTANLKSGLVMRATVSDKLLVATGQPLVDDLVEHHAAATGRNVLGVWLAWKSCAAKAWWCWLTQLPEVRWIVHDVLAGACAAAVGVMVLNVL
jgi:hypothetical protein